MTIATGLTSSVYLTEPSTRVGRIFVNSRVDATIFHHPASIGDYWQIVMDFALSSYLF